MVTEQNSPSNHQKGSRLEHFWLDDEVGKLHPAEQKLLESVATGEVCEIAKERPVAAARENIIRSSLLRFLILGGDELTPVDVRGLRIRGAFIVCNWSNGYLNLQGATIQHNLGLADCFIGGGLILQNAKTKSISLQGSKIESLVGDGVEVEGSIFFGNEFSATDEVRFLGATITGDFICTNSNFGALGKSLRCDGFEVGGSVFLSNGFQASGSVRLMSARIAKNLQCDNAEFKGLGHSLVCDGIIVGGNLSLNEKFRANGEVRLLGARISGLLNCSGGFFAGDDNSILAQNIDVKGNLYLAEAFQARGEVDFRNAHIGGNVYCDDAIFSCKDQALVFNRATIDGMVLLGKGLMSAGQISFSSAKIGRDFSAQGVSLEGNPCLQLRNAEIRGTLTWRRIKYAHGQLDLTGASCRDFSFDAPSWQKPREIKITNFTYKSFTELPKDADGDFWCEWLDKQPNSHQQTKFRPKPYEFLADVLTEMGYGEEARSVRIEKQHKQTDFIHHYQAQPKRSNAIILRRLNIFWRRFVLGPFIDYGYRPGRAGLYLGVIGIIGAFVFWWAAWAGIMTPTHPLIYKEAHASNGAISQACRENWVYASKECITSLPSEHSEFQPFWYSFDVLLPVVNLRQENDWAPRVVHVDGSNWWAGRIIRWWEWFEIAAGWVLSLLFVSAIGGIIKR